MATEESTRESEEWRPVAGTDGWYEVSDLGRVRSWKVPASDRRRETPRILAANPNTDGYPLVQLFVNGIGFPKLVHVLVLETFVGPRPGPVELWDSGHKDNNPSNNRLENLKWCTKGENGDDRKKAGRLLRECREIGGVKHYRCTACGWWKPEAEFGRLSESHPGSVTLIRSACRECERVRDRESKRLSRAKRAALGVPLRAGEET